MGHKYTDLRPQSTGTDIGSPDVLDADTPPSYNATTKKITFTWTGGTTSEMDVTNLFDDKYFTDVVKDDNLKTLTFNIKDGTTKVIDISTWLLSDTIDQTAPVITLIGDNPVTLSVGDVYIEQGVTAVDDIDGNTPSIETTGTVDTSTVGSYIITYTATDSSGNQSTTTRTVLIEEVASSINMINDISTAVTSIGSLTGGITEISNGFNIRVTDGTFPALFYPRITNLLLSEATVVGDEYTVSYDINLISGVAPQMNYSAISEQLGTRGVTLNSGNYSQAITITTDTVYNSQLRLYMDALGAFELEITNIKVVNTAANNNTPSIDGEVPFTPEIPTNNILQAGNHSYTIGAGVTDNGDFVTIPVSNTNGLDLRMTTPLPKSDTTYVVKFRMRASVAGRTIKMLSYSSSQAQHREGRWKTNSQANTWETFYEEISSKDLSWGNYLLRFFSKSNTGIAGNIDIGKDVEIYEGTLNIENSTDIVGKGVVGKMRITDTGAIIDADNKHIIPMICAGSRTVTEAPDLFLNQGFTGIITRGFSGGEFTIARQAANGHSTMGIEIGHMSLSTIAEITNWADALIAKKNEAGVAWDKVLCFYWDNEYYNRSASILHLLNECRRIDASKPILMNLELGYYNLYNGLVDMGSFYYGTDLQWYTWTPSTSPQEQDILSGRIRTENQNKGLRFPINVAHANHGVGINFGSMAIQGIAEGAAIISYWAHGYNQTSAGGATRDLNILNSPVWTQAPVLRQYLDKIAEAGIVLKGVEIGFKIEQFTKDWSNIIGRTGTNGKGYVLATNTTRSADNNSATMVVGYTGLHYTPLKLVDIVSGLEVSGCTIDDTSKTISVQLPAHEYRVLEIVPQ